MPESTFQKGNLKFLSLILLISVCCFVQLFAQPFEEPIKILDGFEFVEGPAVDANGSLFFTDIPPRLIYQYTGAGKATVFLDSTWGANGLAFDLQGRLVACAGKEKRCIYRVEKDGSRTILAESYNGNKLNSPNDLWIDPLGGIYFTDPRYGSTENLEQDGMHVYYLPAGEEKCVRVIDDQKRPNGIIGTPDNKTIYVVDEGVRKTYQYQILKAGVLAEKKLFCDGGIDGLAQVDNLYLVVTMENKVALFSTKGEKINEWRFEHHPTNVCYADGIIYVTTQGGEIFKIKL